MQIGKNFRIARFYKNLSQVELNILTWPKMSTTRISLFERDLVKLNDWEIVTLAKVLQIPHKQGQIENE